MEKRGFTTPTIETMLQELEIKSSLRKISENEIVIESAGNLNQSNRIYRDRNVSGTKSAE